MRYEEALEAWQNRDINKALDLLNCILDLGPKNVRASQLKLEILEQLGLYSQSHDFIQHLIQIPDLPDEILMTIREKIMEEQTAQWYIEHFKGETLFLTPPSFSFATVFLSMIAILLMLALIHFSMSFQIISQSFLILNFFFLVMIPWGIMALANKNKVHSYILSEAGICLRSLNKQRWYKWDEISQIIVKTHLSSSSSPVLSIELTLKDQQPNIILDMSSVSSLHRVRKAFLRLLSFYYPSMCYQAISSNEEIIWSFPSTETVKLENTESFSEDTLQKAS